MKNFYLILFSAFLVFSPKLFSSYRDTGFITWSQPDGTEFIARSWGDEFFYWMETNDGYRIIETSDGWYYYATLDTYGEFTSTSSRVGIDPPLPGSYQLERSAERIAEIEALREEIALERLQESLCPGLIGPFPRNFKLGVVLIDFNPNRRYEDNHGDGYKKYFFDDMIFSEDWYTQYHPERPWQIIGPHPELKEVFGSLRDYYYDMTRGNIILVGRDNEPKIVNPPNPQNPDEPDWLELPKSISYYEELGTVEFLDTLYKHAVLEFGEAEMNSYEVVCFLYGGATRTSGNFRPKTRNAMYVMGKQDYNNFSHIGVHAHEFGHAAFCAHDEYDGIYDPHNWDLMAYGSDNGPDMHGACPAPLSPPYRIHYDWVQPIVVTPNVYNQIIEYNEEYPNLYKIEIRNSEEYFVLERRVPVRFDQYTPKDGAQGSQGILIWHAGDYRDIHDFVQLERADNSSGLSLSDYMGDRFPYPAGTIQNFNDVETPSSNTRDGDYSSISVDNIEFFEGESGFAEVDILDLAPRTPVNFHITGGIGENPTLHWNANLEVDLDGYNITTVRLF